jgi:hypothetical protein
MATLDENQAYSGSVTPFCSGEFLAHGLATQHHLKSMQRFRFVFGLRLILRRSCADILADTRLLLLCLFFLLSPS